MSGAFAFIEAQVNATVMRTLSNRQVLAPVLGLAFVGMFEDAGAAGVDGLTEITQPRLTVSVLEVPELPRDTALVVVNPATLASTAYLTKESEPDGAGFMVYQLREA